ncbi:phage tail protein [Rhodococcus opacus]|uniref:Hypothetical membrane protein n=1 Tax=Rhodococcus opacus (strain B4) TaxID=632772 RepID=C1B4N5_RHOOB|nr:hypothetical protein [Rhodococcus opacus]BAH55224.1 hypothetical membrane protein [Rhodococcus opacus B4]
MAGLGIAMAGMAAAGVAAGAVASAAAAGMTAAIGGALIYFAAKNQEVKDSFTSLKDHVTQSMTDLTGPLVEPLKQFALQARGAFDALAPSISNIVGLLGPMITQIGDKLTPLAQKLGPMLESAFRAGQGPLLAFIDGLGPVTDGMKGFFDAVNRPEVLAFVTTLMTTIGQLLPIIGELLVSLTPIGTAVLPLLVTAFQAVSDVITGTLVPAFTTIGTFLGEHPGLVQGLVAAFVGLKVAMIAAQLAIVLYNGVAVAVRVATIAWTAVQWLLNASMYGFPLVWIIAAIVAVIAIVWLLISNWDTVKAFLLACWEAIKSAAITVWNAILNFLQATWNTIKSVVMGAINFVVNWISNGWSMVFSTATSVWNSIVNFLQNAWNNIRNAVTNGVNEVRNIVTNTFNNILSFIGGLAGRFYTIGVQMIQGLINGVRAMASNIASAARSVVEGAINAAKSALSIGSPSKLFRQFGIWTGEGYVLGIKDEAKAVEKAGASIGIAAQKGFESKPFFSAGLTIGEQVAEGIKKASSSVASAASGLSGIATARLGGWEGRLEFDAAVTGRGGAGSTITLNVQSGISSPEETGRAVVTAIQDFERVNGSRWRE